MGSTSEGSGIARFQGVLTIGRHGSSQAMTPVVARYSLSVPDGDVIMVAHVVRQAHRALSGRAIYFGAVALLTCGVGPTIAIKHCLPQLGQRPT